jgi:hypothetical protein
MVFILLVTSGYVHADVSDVRRIGHPNQGDSPVEISVGVFIVNLVEVDSLEESFRADFIIISKWHDPRLADASLRGKTRTADIDDIWNPELDIINQRSLDIRKDIVHINADGNVEHIRRYFGNLSSTLDLKSFPFDTQKLPIEIYSSALPGTVVLKGKEDLTGMLSDNILAGWKVSDMEITKTPVPVQVLGRNIEFILFNIQAERLANYYLWKLILPLSFIVMMSWLVFWINPMHFAPQLALSTASVFTLTTYLIQLGSTMPKINYLTKADTFILGCMILVFSAVAEAVIASRLSNIGKEKLAKKIDSWARWIYLGLFAALLIIV